MRIWPMLPIAFLSKSQRDVMPTISDALQQNVPAEIFATIGSAQKWPCVGAHPGVLMVKERIFMRWGVIAGCLDSFVLMGQASVFHTLYHRYLRPYPAQISLQRPIFRLIFRLPS